MPEWQRVVPNNKLCALSCQVLSSDGSYVYLCVFAMLWLYSSAKNGWFTDWSRVMMHVSGTFGSS